MGSYTDLFSSYISFARPSPLPKRDQLLVELHELEASPSLLFQSNRSVVKKEDH